MQKRKIHPSPLIENELYDDEELIWEGKPNPIRFIRQADWFAVVFGLGFAAFAVFFISMALEMFDPTPAFGGFSRRSGPPAVFKLFFLAIPTVFIFVGLRQAADPVLKFIEGMGTTYALTNKRAIIVTQTWSKSVQSFYDESIDRITTRMHMDGTGDVIFSSRQVTQRVHQGRRSYPRTISKEEGFLGIQDAREVEDLLSQIFFDDSQKDKSQPKGIPTPEQPTVADLEDRFGALPKRDKYASNQSRKNPPVAQDAEIILTQSEIDELRDLKRKKVVWKEPSRRLLEYGYVKKVHSRGDYLFEITDKGEAALK